MLATGSTLFVRLLLAVSFGRGKIIIECGLTPRAADSRFALSVMGGVARAAPLAAPALGPAAGDRFLTEFGRLLKDSIRLNDVVVRTGGEEFLVVLKNTDMAYLDLFATKILGKIGEQSFVLSEVEGRTIHKTCSVGYSAFPLVDAEPDRYNFEQIMMLADQALYYAKAHGRNQAVRVLAGPARPENPEQTEKLLRNLE